MIAIYIVIGFLGGVIIAYLLMRLQHSSSQRTLQIENTRISTLLEQKENALEEQRKNLEDEIFRINSRNSEEIERLTKSFQDEKIRIENNHANERKHQEEIFNIERARIEKNRLIAEENAEKMRLESDKQWQLKFDKLKEEFQNTANNLLEAKQAALKENNKEQLGELLSPIKEEFEAFRKSVEESKTSNEVAKNELKDSFQTTMKLFAQQQNQAVEALKQETIKIGNDANNLTNALKRDTKKQGNWGELVLETLLETSGLEKDVNYFIQETVKDEDGKMLRPDVIVKFPEGRSVIIDSKVSLTAYTEAFETEDEDLKKRRLKDHARSVRKHVDELSGKKYDSVVSDSIGFILMFIPNDQCYLAALEEDGDLSRYAYGKGIVIISPSNLMMALQLAYNLWQQHIRNKNIDNIVKTAGDLYDKVALFSESMEGVERNIQQLNNSFQKAKKQMYEGNGNIFRKVENLKNLGITPKKQIRGLSAEDEGGC